jgi:ectoine hydroxylase-related dioxygenase (phytanoyl-CoA dioxygenase family)
MTAETLREKYKLSLEQRRFFGLHGYLKIGGLIAPEELRELDEHSMSLARNQVDLSPIEGLNPRNEGTSPADMKDKYFRFIQFHRHLEVHERYLLHPRVLDVLEALIGPDVMAMQSMLFLKPPGKPGQAFHQDSFYIKTFPDTLCGAWIAIDECDEENGCMGFIAGSHFEPIYQEVAKPGNTRDFQANLIEVQGVDERREVMAEARAGDVVFFHGHLIHRSRQNRSQDRFRRAYVCHYANARSYTEWGGGNSNHLLARGATHLQFARARFTQFEPEPAGGV